MHCAQDIHRQCAYESQNGMNLLECLFRRGERQSFGEHCESALGDVVDFMARFVGTGIASIKGACSVDASELCSLDLNNIPTKLQDGTMSCLVKNTNKMTNPFCRDQLQELTAAVYRFSRKHTSQISDFCEGDLNSSCSGREGIDLFTCAIELENASESCQRVIDLINGDLAIQSERNKASSNRGQTTVNETKSASKATTPGNATSGITLSGPIAFAAIAALVIVCLAAGLYVYRKYTGSAVYRPYTIIKSGDV